ncbi:MAG: hypothetical protein JWP77_2723 [Polaromonas sp.]|jgi:hypothetical protein|nr:hypothetical protein [Polaromonas sp.]
MYVNGWLRLIGLHHDGKSACRPAVIEAVDKTVN